MAMPTRKIPTRKAPTKKTAAKKKVAKPMPKTVQSLLAIPGLTIDACLRALFKGGFDKSPQLSCAVVYFPTIAGCTPVSLYNLTRFAFKCSTKNATAETFRSERAISAWYLEVKNKGVLWDLPVHVTHPSIPFKKCTNFADALLAVGSEYNNIAHLALSPLELRLLNDLLVYSAFDATDFYSDMDEYTNLQDDFANSVFDDLNAKVDQLVCRPGNPQNYGKQEYPAPPVLEFDMLEINGETPEILDNGDLVVGCTTVPYAYVQIIAKECAEKVGKTKPQKK